MRDDPHLRIQIIVTSDLKRAVQTATIIAEVLHIPMQDVRLDSRLRECSFGNLEVSTFFALSLDMEGTGATNRARESLQNRLEREHDCLPRYPPCLMKV